MPTNLKKQHFALNGFHKRNLQATTPQWQRVFYKNQGIDLEIIPGGPGIVPSQNLAKKKETFGTDLLIGAMSLAAKGAPVINIGQIFQTTALALITKKSTNINSPQEMDKKKVGVWPGLFQVPPIVMFRRLKVAPVTQIQKFSMVEFIEGKVDVASAMTYNEYLVALQMHTRKRHESVSL